ncbi:Uncharacterized protein OBRU01_12806 [Operophtera brumata]|uniref:EF-hand domain-containing protein n=1 Tax=Operophtera brumata TaxID=104452 RepID=A0A0L7L9H2_OPEBR|nr:Uncharacterized protein OBRU01_12806 [Operophtera brumata]
MLQHSCQMDKNYKAYTDDQLESVLEHALKHTDINRDGYIDFIEYRLFIMTIEILHNILLV